MTRKSVNGSLAQLGEHLPYKQRVTGSSPVVPTKGPVVQLVRTLACHARGREFEPHPGRQCGFSSSGRAPPCQGGGSEFEPRNPLHIELGKYPWLAKTRSVSVSGFFLIYNYKGDIMEKEMRYAVLIDSDNVAAKYTKFILDEVSNYGVVTYKRVYGDWTRDNSVRWNTMALENAITPVQQYTLI